jgi:CBS domain-containing protein
MSSKIATGRFNYCCSKKNHVNSVVTVPENVSLAEAQLLMLKNNVAHLCVTADGTNKSIVKVISEHD